MDNIIIVREAAETHTAVMVGDAHDDDMTRAEFETAARLAQVAIVKSELLPSGKTAQIWVCFQS
jgi:hypothetical protein